MKKYKLMLKQHNITGMKYLCITKRKNYEKYLGSGKYWKLHLKKYGNNITTILLEETDDENELAELGKYYSKLFDVVNSECFANLINECGYTCLDNPYYKLSKEEKEKRLKSSSLHKKEAWKNKSEEEKEIIKRKIKETWKNKSEEELKNFSDKMKLIASTINFSKIAKETWKNKSEEEMKKFSDKMKSVWENSSDEYKKEFSLKVSNGRLNMSEEAKQLRKENFIKSRNNNIEKYLKIWNKFSEERKSINNPAAKLIKYFDKIYTKSEFESKFGKIEKFENDINFKKLYTETNTNYETIICPYCGKTCNKKPSSFKRWHFENCKNKPEENTNENYIN